MALIKCPECGKEISDKAKACIHCGYPLDYLETTSEQPVVPKDNALYNVILVDTKNVVKAISAYQGLSGSKLIDAKERIMKRPCIIARNVSRSEADSIKNQFEALGDTTVAIESTDGKSEYVNEVKRDELRCPKCGSTAVEIGQRGFSIMTGFLGAGQTMNRCGNCGHKWKPKK